MIKENWVKEDTQRAYRKKAREFSKKRKEFESNNKFVAVKHPTSPRCVILKKVKK